MTLINCQLKGVLCGCSLSSGQQLVSPLAQFQLREVEGLQPSLVTATEGVFTTKGWFRQSMGVCSSFLFEGRKGALLTVSAAQGQPRAVLLNTAKLIIKLLTTTTNLIFHKVWYLRGER